jgi:putative xylitol transport system ATP-binding protein
LNCVYGTEQPDAGEIRINGQPVAIHKPADALRQGMALITEDRKETGLVLTMSIRENVSLSSLAKLSHLGVVDENRERKSVEKMIDLFHVKATSMDALVKTMSGGNQQKVVFSRCLSTNPRILLCDEPTRGIDEGTKREMYAFLSSFAQAGNCVIFVSSEIPEVLGMSDRIVVFRRGRIAGELSRSEADQDQLMRLAS